MILRKSRRVKFSFSTSTGGFTKRRMVFYLKFALFWKGDDTSSLSLSFSLLSLSHSPSTFLSLSACWYNKSFSAYFSAIFCFPLPFTIPIISSKLWLSAFHEVSLSLYLSISISLHLSLSLSLSLILFPLSISFSLYSRSILSVSCFRIETRLLFSSSRDRTVRGIWDTMHSHGLSLGSTVETFHNAPICQPRHRSPHGSWRWQAHKTYSRRSTPTSLSSALSSS